MSSRRCALQSCVALTLLLSGLVGSQCVLADDDGHHNAGLGVGDDNGGFSPGNLLVSRVVYDNNPKNIQVGTSLPPGCVPSSTVTCSNATNDGSFPYVWNNALVDGSFGITSKIVLDQLEPSGRFISSLDVPSQQAGADRINGMIGSFSSKSEDALNLSTDGRYVTLMGYRAPENTIDVSNSNTPGVVDPTNPVLSAFYRVVARVDAHGHFRFTLTNAYSGNNGRAAILNNSGSNDLIYTSGNAGNGSNPQPTGVILGAGTQIMTASKQPEAEQNPGLPTPVGSFSITELGNKADKVGKDTNFRGLTIFNNVVYLTKGSGGNGINTVYFIDTTGSACPKGVGVPQPSASLPTAPIAYNASVLTTQGVTPYNMCVLAGFPTVLAKNPTAFPFGLWFANATTLYVADEGTGTNTYDSTQNLYTGATTQNSGGLQKWVFNSASGSWQLAYTLTAGLNLGVPYTIAGYPTGDNAATNLPWSPATDGLRNITGRVNRDGTVTIWAITSTVSGNGDQGADPNKLVAITDKLSASALPGDESFKTLRTAGFGEALRGVSFTPEAREVTER
jgi:hypothetical protein